MYKSTIRLRLFSLCCNSRFRCVSKLQERKGVTRVSGLRELQDYIFISLNKETLERGFILNIVESQCVNIFQT